jgi:O-antigen/teichoic acid export membrane protein
VMKLRETSAKLGKNAAYMALSSVAAIIIGLGFISIFPRLTGPAVMGFYSYWFSIFSVLTMFLEFGTNNVLKRYLPELRVECNGQIRPLLMKLLTLKLILIIPSLVVGLFVFREYIVLFLIVLFGAFLDSVCSLSTTVFYSFQEMRRYTITTSAVLVFRATALILLFLFLGQPGIIFAFLFSPILVLSMNSMELSTIVPASKEKLDRPLKTYLVFGILVYASDLLFTLTTRMVVVFSKEYLSLEEVGFIGLASIICLTNIRQIVAAIGTGILPAMVHMKASGEYKKLKRTLELSWRYSAVSFGLITLGTFFLMDAAIRILAGEEYALSGQLVILFLPTVGFMVVYQLLQQVFFMYDRKWSLITAQIAGFALFCLTFFISIGKVGILAAPLATAVGSGLSVVVLLSVWNNLPRIPKMGSNSVKVLIATLLSGVVTRNVTVQWGTHIFLGLSVGIGTYFIILWALKTIEYDDFVKVRGMVRWRS